MIITESFVWINYPKTASTFVREALFELYQPNPRDFLRRLQMRNRHMREIMCPEQRPHSGQRRGEPTPHGTVSQIPEECRHLPILSSFRAPLSRYLSLYNYGDWKKPDQFPAALDRIKIEFPEFPNLGLREFIRFVDYYYGNVTLQVGEDRVKIGPHSADFLRFYTKPLRDEGQFMEYEDWGGMEADLRKVTFLESSNINRDLARTLLGFGFAARDVKFMENKAPTNISEKSSSGRELLESDVRSVEETEWLLGLWMKSLEGDLARNLQLEARSGKHQNSRVR